MYCAQRHQRNKRKHAAIDKMAGDHFALRCHCRNTVHVDAAYCYRQLSVVCLSVCLSVCHDREACKNGWTDQDAVWDVDSDGPKEACIRLGAHWRPLANTTEPSCAAVMRPYVKLEIRSVERGICPTAESIMTDSVIFQCACLKLSYFYFRSQIWWSERSKWPTCVIVSNFVARWRRLTILTVPTVKFRGDRSNCCGDVTIFRFFQDGGCPPSLTCDVHV